jgi:pectate lyase
MVHAYNNYLRNWDSYGMGVEDGGELNSQANIFEAGADKRALRSDGIGGGEVGNARSTDDLLLNGAAVQVRTPEKVFQPPYQVTVERADSALRDRIVASVGLQALSTP